MHTHTHTHTHTHIHTHIYTHAGTHTHTHARTRTHARMHARTHTHARTHACTVLLISASIGLFAAVKHRNAPAEHLLTANRKLPLLPVALSLAASFMSAIFVLGVPAEAYLNSTEYWLIGLGYIPAEIITCLLIMPVFYKLKLTSAYQVGTLLLE